MPSVSNETASRRATYSALTGIFVAAFAMVSRRKTPPGQELEFRPFDLVQLGLATYRLGRMIAYDSVFETFRSPFAETVPDGSGAGMTVRAKGTGAQHALGELISCPICVGTWVAAGLVYGLKLAPGPSRTFLAIMSSVGAAELLDASTEALQWAGQLARECSGSARSGKGEWT